MHNNNIITRVLLPYESVHCDVVTLQSKESCLVSASNEYSATNESFNEDNDTYGW